MTAVGRETSQPEPGSTTTAHKEGYEAGATETYPMVEVKISLPRRSAILESVMDAVLWVHAYEEPVIYLREDWVSRAAYDPNSNNPNRWWNNGRGMPNQLD